MKNVFLFTALIGWLNSFAQDPIVTANNDFAFRIYHATHPESSNFFISPFSLSIALGIVNEGAAGITRTEMDKLLSTGDLANRSAAYTKLLNKSLNTEKGDKCMQWPENKKAENKLLMANSVWIRNDTKVKEGYREIIEKDYASSVFQFNQTDLSGINQKLNTWVSDKTTGRINGLELDTNVRMSIINAIYFIGEWQVPFDNKETKSRNFHTLSKEKVKMDFLKMQSYFSYYENTEIQAISIPYNCDEFSMVILLPKKRYGITELEKKLTSAYFAKVDSSYSHEVILSIPKFKIESQIFPIENIKAMGYTKMFSDSADFSEMSYTPLKIGNIVHKTFIEIDEARTEAAAVTEVEMVIVAGGGGEPVEPPHPKIFDANHPFVFLIIDKRSKAILFMGRVVE